MYKVIWITVAVLVVAILMYFCWLIWQLSELVACKNMPLDQLTAHCAEIVR